MADLKLHGVNDWDKEKLLDIFEPLSVAAILKLSWPNIQCEDKLVWIGNSNGVFSVNDCYLAIFRSVPISEEAKIWENLWNSKLHERLKLFLWRLLVGILPTNLIIFTRTGKGCPDCALCGKEEETEIHLFTKCEETKLLAFASS